MPQLDFETPLGPMRAIIDGDALVVLDFLDSRNLPSGAGVPAAQSPEGILPSAPQLELLKQTQAQVLEYFDRKRTEFDLPLNPQGTETQRRVWAELTEIPYGHTTTYGKLAERLGIENGQRAVGMINGQNPIAIVIPCHRVIASTGKLQGYAGGLERKRFLLDLESGPNLFN